jgi:hypothetical protein
MRHLLLLATLVTLAGTMHAAVVVELFTSQGCSSCPPADALLHELESDPEVIAIAYHVDYWDAQGWRDPFSSPTWTQRQMAYVHAMQLPSAYTPQIVVGGTQQMVGSSGPVVRTAIGRIAREQATATLDLSRASGVAVVQTSVVAEGLELIVVALQDRSVTRVERGENAGRTLTSDCIARKLVRIAAVPAGEHVFRVPIEGQRIVAMLQDPRTMRIHAAAVRRTGGPSATADRTRYTDTIRTWLPLHRLYVRSPSKRSMPRASVWPAWSPAHR